MTAKIYQLAKNPIRKSFCQVLITDGQTGVYGVFLVVSAHLPDFTTLVYIFCSCKEHSVYISLSKENM